nr:UPF0236 family protein [Candidatus Galacturonibacter soehngenii]
MIPAIVIASLSYELFYHKYQCYCYNFSLASQVECSAEGHISHILADRMSSRPLGWSKTGADKMSRLRIYKSNKADILELVRYQKQEFAQAVGCEEVMYNSNQMFQMERANRKRLGNLADIPVYSIPYTQIKKIAALKNHIWGL